jgi:hypothetical protein
MMALAERDTVKTLAVLLLLLLCPLSFGQTPTTKAQKQDCASATKAFNAQPAYKLSLENYMALSEAMDKACGTKAPEFYPVSKYVRKIGVLYLKTIDEFKKHCDGQMSNAAVESKCSAAMANWQSTFDQIEPMVEIELSDSKSAGDIRTWELLKETKIATNMYLQGFMLNGDPGVAVMESWTKAMSTCRTYAEFAVFGSGSRTADADIGTYSGDGGCSELIDKALHPKPAPQTISVELRAKCTPFADGSAEKVLAKTMPLPPKECREALGWMRDSRVSALYDGQSK